MFYELNRILMLVILVYVCVYEVCGCVSICMCARMCIHMRAGVYILACVHMWRPQNNSGSCFSRGVNFFFFNLWDGVSH